MGTPSMGSAEPKATDGRSLSGEPSGNADDVHGRLG